jgi:signal transduction histidine kinase
VTDVLERIRALPLFSHVSGSQRVWGLNVALLATATAQLWLLRGRVAPLDGPSIPWEALALSFALAEVFVMHVRIAKHAHTFALAEIPLVVGLAYSSPIHLVLAGAVGFSLALALHRRQKPLRLVFNVSQRSVTTLVAVGVFNLVVDAGGSSWPVVCGAALLATLVADILAAVLINVGIALSEGTKVVFEQVVGMGTALTFANTALALVTVMMLSLHPATVLLVAAPAAATYLAGKAYADVQRKHDNLALLQRSTALAQGSLNIREMLPPLLDHIRQMFHADVAELLLWPQFGGVDSLSTRIGPGDKRSLMHPVTLEPTEGVWARVWAEHVGILLPRPIRNERLAEYFADQGIRDVIVVPVLSDKEVVGTLMAANRLGDFSTFDTEDMELLGTVADHVGVAIRNSRLVRRLEEALAHETEMSRLKDDFVATISHELRTPLTNVQGYVKTLLREDIAVPAKEQREFLEHADRHAERLKHLIEDLLFASRVESSGAGGWTSVGIAGLVERIAEDQARELDPGRIVLSFPGNLPPIRSREEDVYRVIGNLVDNALKYSPPESAVAVRGEIDGDGVRISVHDRGTGISLEEQERIFERFYQVDQSLTRRVGGAGMGLYICRKAAEGLGGRVWLERSDPTGSVFAAWLPLEPPIEIDGPADLNDVPVVVP